MWRNDRQHHRCWISTATCLGPTIPVDAGTIGLLSGNTLYVAGTKPGANTCAGSATRPLGHHLRRSFRRLIWRRMTVTATATITDGYHNHMEMGANNQLFIGARTCTNIKVPASGSNPGEVRGCLSIFDTEQDEQSSSRPQSVTSPEFSPSAAAT